MKSDDWLCFFASVGIALIILLLVFGITYLINNHCGCGL
jgi:hypothetical protein